MAVHKRAYRPYEGPLTAERWRFLVLPRYAFRELFESRVLTAFLVLCLFPALVEAAGIYIANSAAARALLRLPSGSDAMRPDFFLTALTVQGFLAFFLTAWVAPVLVSPDLVNGALPLYLSRPFSRAEYVLGKATVLLSLLSLITWVPLLALVALQGSLASGWLAANLRSAWAVFAGAVVWIAVLTLLGLALSACIRWRLVASAALFAVFFIGMALGEMWRSVLFSPWGRLANLTYLIGIVWHDLFGIALRRPLAREMLDDPRAADLPAWTAWLGLLTVCALCLWLLDRRLQAREVVS